MTGPAAPEAGGPAIELEIRSARSADEAEREGFARAQPAATFFHQRGWARFVARTWGHADHELQAWRGERLVGVLPLMACEGLAGGRRLVSLPYAVYGGPLAEEHAVARRLAQEARRLAERLGARRVELRCLQDPGLELPGSDLYWTFRRELPAAPAEVLARMPKKARAEARKARERFGLELAEGPWFTGDLARLFLENKRALGSPGLPLHHFRNLLAEFPGQAFVHVVRDGKRPIASALSLAFRDTLIAYYAGTEPGADRERSASNFLYMALQEWAVQRGFRVFDLCRSRAGSGAFAFKCHQGFEPAPLHYRYDLLGSAGLPSFHPSNPRTELLRSAWSHLPRWAARALSRRLPRYLP